MFSKDKLPVFVQKCAFLDTMALFLRGVRGALMSVVDWQRGIQDEIHDGTFPPSRPLLARSLVFFPSLNLLYRKFRNKMEQGRESDR